ncbi:MAG: DUF2752 domain-containing protein [Clostridiales bacterium]|nr:DUF2752 domain-containing protein [Clostridiales bacterium]
MKARAFYLLKKAALICLVGSGYALFCTLTGWGIPCFFHLLTGLDCPGCGISRLCLALLRLDFAAAFRANAALLLLLPLFAAVAFSLLIRYLRTGDTRPRRWESVLLILTTVLLLLFGILRNLPFYPF